MTFSIEIDIDSINYRPPFSTTGKVEIQVRNRVFPAPGWGDFVTTVLFWWVGSFYRFMANEGVEDFEFDFMEGSYSVRGSMSPEPGYVDLVFIESDEPSCSVQKISLSHVACELIKASRRCLERLDNLSAPASELEQLDRITTKLEELVAL